MNKIDYIECAGVRVPANWTANHLAEALAKRKIRFWNEQEIMNVFGDAICLKATLESEISQLRIQLSKLDGEIKKKRGEINANNRKIS